MLLGTTAIIGYANAPQYIDSKGGNGIVCLENDVPADKPTKENIKLALADAVNKYGGGYADLLKVLQCESSLLHYGVFGDNSRAYGVAQFHEPTFKQVCKGDYKNYKDQINCFVKMMSQGLGKHWTCAKLFD